MPERDSRQQSARRRVAEHGTPGALDRLSGGVETSCVFDLVDDV
jgi:hypothetical protein